MFKIKIKILINQCFQTELLKTVEDISFIEFVSMNENNIYKISNKNNNENNNDLETIAGPLFVDDMIFKTTGKSSSTLLKRKRDKLREDRFKE